MGLSVEIIVSHHLCLWVNATVYVFDITGELM